EVKTSKNRKTTQIDYLATVQPPYHIAEIEYPIDSGAISHLINASKTETEVEPGVRFDVDDFNEEFERIEAYLKNQGYYYFDTRYLVFDADTTIGDRQVNLYLRVEENAPQEVISRYKINRIKVVPNYSLNNRGVSNLGRTVMV